MIVQFYIVYHLCFHLISAPSLRRGAAVLPYTGDPDLEGASRTHAFLVENPCNRKGEIFSEEEGPVESIDLVVKDIRSEADQGKKKIFSKSFHEIVFGGRLAKNKYSHIDNVWGSLPRPVKSDTVSKTARHRCDVFSECVAQALSRGDARPRHSLRASA